MMAREGFEPSLLIFGQVGHGGPEGAYSYVTRVGFRVPVPGAGKDGQTSFVDVGSNIDAG